MSHVWIFIALMMALSVQTLWRGGAPERLACLAMLAATAATILANFDQALPFRAVEWRLLWIDASLLAIFVAIALKANRFWPLWLAALQCLAVAAHAARGFEPSILPIAYWWLVGKVAYPMLLLLWLGSERHHRRRAQGLPDNPWTPLASCSGKRAASAGAMSRRATGTAETNGYGTTRS